MEPKALCINKAVSILPWLLLCLLAFTVFLDLLLPSSINPFIISTSNQILPFSQNKAIHALTSTSSSSNLTNNTNDGSVNQIPTLHEESDFLLSQRDEIPDGSGEKCDLFSGRWVKDPRPPIYTNLTCPTIPDDDNCWRYGKDQGYTYWRWKPDGCELKRFEPRVFLNVVRGKKMAFIGDSLARNHMESLLCLLTQVSVTSRSPVMATFYFFSPNSCGSLSNIPFSSDGNISNSFPSNSDKNPTQTDKNL